MYKKGFRIFIILIIFSLSISNYLSGQNKIDSLKNLLKTTDSIADIYYQIAYLMHYENLDSCIYYGKKSIKYTKKEDTENISYVSLLMGVTYKDKAKYDSALYFINQAKNIFISDKYSIGVASCNNDIARIYQEIGDYDKSLSYYFESIKIFKELKDTNNLANVYSNIGELYIEINNFNQALKFFDISKDFYQKSKLKKGQAIVFSDVANVYTKQKKYQKAKILYIKSAKIWEDLNQKTEAGKIYINIVENCMKLNNYKTALLYSKKALNYFRKTKFSSGKVDALTAIGDYYFYTKNIQLSIKKYHDALEQIPDSNSHKTLLTIYTKLYSAYKLLKNSDSAISYLEKSQILKDSIFNIEQAKNLNNLQIKYEIKNKENEILSLKNTTKIKQLEIDKKNSEAKNRLTIIILLFILVIGLSLYSFVFYRLYKQKKELSKELLIRLDEREILLKEIHHRVKNNLQIISSLFSLQKNNSQNMSIDEIIDISKNRIATMINIHEKLYKSENIKFINIKEYITEISENICQSLNKSSTKINLNINIETIKWEINTSISFGLILNELITNSIKYAFSEQKTPNISITGKNIKNLSIIEYSDNGKGWPKDFDISKTNTLGLKLITGLTKQLKASFTTEDTKIGIKLVFKIPC